MYRKWLYDAKPTSLHFSLSEILYDCLLSEQECGTTSRLMGVRGEYAPWPSRRFSVYIVYTMRRTHRLAGLLSTLSLVTSLVVTSGFACELPGGANQVPGMAMANAADAPSPVGSMGSTIGEAPAPDPAPCGLPSAPSACQSMIACVPTAVASQRVGISATSGAMVRVASLAVLTPSSETIAPELPPPRA